VIGITMLALAGCQQGPSPQVQQQLDQLTQAAAEKDQVIEELTQAARLITDISTELSKVQTQRQVAAAKIQSESPRTAQRDTLMWRVRDVVTRVRQGESRLREARTRIQALEHVSDSLKSSLEGTIAQFQATLDQQKQAITDLNAQLQVAQTQNAELSVKTVALEDTVRSMSVAYYVVGTKEELMQQGIVVEEGGSRVLFIFGKRGKTLQPARDLPVTAFTPIDARAVTQIPLPDPEAEYRIASRQNLEYLATPPGEDGRFSGAALNIAAPDRFWLPSKFLIIVKTSA
jgi:hypothetical protein